MFIVLGLTETWMKPNECVTSNADNPVVDQPYLTGQGGGITFLFLLLRRSTKNDIYVHSRFSRG